LFRPYIDEGEISNLSAFNFFVRSSAIKSQEPLSGTTLLLENEGDNATAESVIENTRQHFTTRQVKRSSRGKIRKNVTRNSNLKIQKGSPITGNMPEKLY
jgi:hypothetical protein